MKRTWVSDAEFKSKCVSCFSLKLFKLISHILKILKKKNTSEFTLGFSLLTLPFPLGWVQRVLKHLQMSIFFSPLSCMRWDISFSIIQADWLHCLKKICGLVSGYLLGLYLDCRIIFCISRCS